LFDLVKPTHAYFGEKDFQQLTVIKAWVKDLKIPVQIVPCPTFRESDGLAMSSRNRYLDAAQRKEAASLYEVLSAARNMFKEGHTNWSEIKKMVLLKLSPLFVLDYFECVDSQNLGAQNLVTQNCRLIIAAKIGPVRLIDNIGLTHEQP
jgi:pantoate--beta-alanine ligase